MGCGNSKPADVGRNGEQAARILRGAAASISGLLTLLEGMIQNEDAKASMTEAKKILEAISATSGGFGNVFKEVGEITTFTDVPDLNNDGVIDWQDRMASVLGDILRLASRVTNEMEEIVEELQRQGLGSDEEKQKMADTVSVLGRVQLTLTTVKAILGAVLGVTLGELTQDTAAAVIKIHEGKVANADEYVAARLTIT